MIDLSVVRAGVARRIAEENRDVTLDAWVTPGTGVAFTVLTFGFVFVLTWMLAFLLGGGRHSEAGVAATITGVFFAVGTYSAWRRVDPLANLEPEDASLFGSAALTMATGMPVAFHPRQATAGAAAFLIGGQANILESIGHFRSGIPTDSPRVNTAAELLVSAERGVRLDSLDAADSANSAGSAGRAGSAEAIVLLRRLGLLRVTRVANGRTCEPTEKGHATLQGRT
ncbi:MAG: hypothetical protein AB8G96_02405 [Phycisphaerales bacterium]